MHTHRTFRQNIFFFLPPEVRCRLSVKNKMTRRKVELTGETKRQNGENEKKKHIQRKIKRRATGMISERRSHEVGHLDNKVRTEMC